MINILETENETSRWAYTALLFYSFRIILLHSIYSNCRDCLVLNDWGIINSSRMECKPIAGLPQYPFIHLAEKRHFEN